MLDGRTIELPDDMTAAEAHELEMAGVAAKPAPCERDGPTQRPRPRGMQPMDPSAATGNVPAKDPHLPPLCRVGDLLAPKAPRDIAAAVR